MRHGNLSTFVADVSDTCGYLTDGGTAWYSEFDPHAAAWLRELIARDLIPMGVVDDRDMREVVPADLDGVVQAHWFAGIGGWPHALRLASWPDDRPVWTASLPCQPFSAAGRKREFEDDRDLWPSFLPLVAELRPPVIVGEQVSGGSGRRWFARVRDDLEAVGYAVGALDLPACSVYAPHQRNRLYWVAHSHSKRGRKNPRAASRNEETDGGWAENDHSSECASAGSGRSRKLADTNDAIQRSAQGHAFTEHDRWYDIGGSGDGSGRELGGPQKRDSESTARRRSGEVVRSANQQPLQADGGDGGGSDRRLDDPEGVGWSDGDSSHQRATCGELNSFASSGEGGYWHTAEFFVWADGKARRAGHRIRWVADGVPSVLESGGNSGTEIEEVVAEVEAASIAAHLSFMLVEPTWAQDLDAQGATPLLVSALRDSGLLPDDPTLIPQAWMSAAPEARESVGRYLWEHGVRLEILSPLAVGERKRASLIKGYGNAIVPQVGAMFIRLFMDEI